MSKNQASGFFPVPVIPGKVLINQHYLTVLFKNKYHIQCILSPAFTARLPLIFSDLEAATAIIPEIFAEAVALADSTDCAVSFCFAFQSTIVAAPDLITEANKEAITESLIFHVKEAYNMWSKINKSIREEILL